MKVTNQVGLVFDFHDSGAIAEVAVDAMRVGLRRSSPWSRAGANLYLRKRDLELSYTPLLGPDSPSQYCSADGVLEARGSWAGLDYVCILQLAAAQAAWQWRVRIESRLDAPVELDLIYVQDVGLGEAGAGLVNEHYVSQYLERRILQHPQHGAVLCCRQNMRTSTGHPWLMIACAERALAASTDGLQLYGRSFRATGEPEALRTRTLAGELAGEASVVAIQAAPFVLGPAQSHTGRFVATYLPDHPLASTEQDLQRLPELLGAFASAPPPCAAAPTRPAPDRFRSARLLPAEDLTRDELCAWFGGEWRQIEESQGELLSFFTDGPRHVVLRAKEMRVDRPHGHILQAGGGSVPDERILSSTAFACGVFNSHLTQGNTNFNTLLSVCTQPAAPALEGQRVLVRLPDGEYLLGVPSAFEIGLGHCRWIYKHGAHHLEVCSWTSPAEPRVSLAINVLRGGPLPLALSHDFDAANGWKITHSSEQELVARPREDSMLAAQYPDAQFRLLAVAPSRAYAHDGLLVIEVPATDAFCMSFVGEVCGPVAAEPIGDADAARRAAAQASLAAWRALSRELSLSGPADISAIDEILPWYGQNALVHYLTPYGLEQFSGAAWGTRDVCQGPVELLLCQEKYDEARQVLHRLFSHQNADGGWPQWWMFDRYRAVRADGAHGDVVYWCVLALGSYIKASGDLGILDARLPYFDAAESAPISEHVERLFQLVERSFVPGTALVQFGGGDWNDSLQPVSKDLARRLISSWTVQMSYQAFSEYAEICERAGQVSRAGALREQAAQVLADFQRHLVRDGVVAGYGWVKDQGIDVLLHPGDATTGVRYSLLPMDRGVISGVFDRAQAEQHLALIEQRLKGPDGARLMDRPLRYHGGPQSIFQRAESSTYFGREIGLMYVHEHLRYAETQARMGRADAFLRALRQANPVGYREVVPQAALRQANCYYSSSDVDFESRYDADARYDEVIAGGLPLKGGWRVYSSGPGIYVSLIVTRLLGLRIEHDKLILDPVLARSLDGLTARLRLRGRKIRLVYRVAGAGFGPRALAVNGEPLAFEREPNRYREGGAVVSLDSFLARLDEPENEIALQV